MTKEEVLQKVADYCTEKSYNETLTEDFRDKFAEFFSKKYPETDADDEAALSDMKFNLNTAFSATSKGVTAKQNAFTERENELNKQIEELKKKLGKGGKGEETPKIPQEVLDQLNELKNFKDEEAKKNKKNAILSLAKKSVREDLHSSFEKFANDTEVSLEKTDKEQADALVAKFQDIFKDTIGEIKPLQPRQQIKRDADYIGSLPKIKVT